MRLLVLFLLGFAASVCADSSVIDRFGRELIIAEAHSDGEIDRIQGKRVLVRSFMAGYEDVPLVELNAAFRSIGDVRRFYEDYFESEFGHYLGGELVWVQAFDKERLIGWATFEMESDTEAYMNLLAVDPDEWRRGVGEALTFSILHLRPGVREIRLLLRKVNEKGRKFYEKIGFYDFEYEREDNFVDVSLLTGLRWVSPCAQKGNQFE